jgi:hypothetical protein
MSKRLSPQNSIERNRSSKAELKVQALARRVAEQELLSVSWNRFRCAYEEYPRWQGLSLWAEAAGRLAGPYRSEIRAVLKKHCPGLVESWPPSRRIEGLGLSVLEWVHTKRFGYAKRQGWLSALIFYGVRHPYSRGAWECWQHWNAQQSLTVLPRFSRWWRSALRSPVAAQASAIALASATQRYLQWEAVTFWLQPVFTSGVGLPSDAAAQIRRCCPGIVSLYASIGLKGHSCLSLWEKIVKAGDNYLLAQAKVEGWSAIFAQQVQTHPWHVRMRVYSECKRESTANAGVRYPSLRQWKQAARQYVSGR